MKVGLGRGRGTAAGRLGTLALRASLLAGAVLLGAAAVALADSPYPTSVDVDQDGATVTLTGTWEWPEKNAPCGPGTSANRAAGWAADWGDGWDGNVIKRKGYPSSAVFHMGTADDNAVRVSDANGGLGDCGFALLGGRGVQGTWGPLTHTFPGPGEYVVCVITYDVHLETRGGTTTVKAAKELTAGGRDHNGDNSAETRYVGKQCAGGDDGITIIVVGPTPAPTPSPTPAPTPEVTLVKTTETKEFSRVAGQTITFEFTVTNTGPVRLAGPVTVTDDMVPTVICPAVSTVGNKDGYLDMGESIVCSGDYVVSEADVTAGAIRNVAGATIDGVDSNEDRVVVPEAPTVAVLLDGSGSVKSARTRTINHYNAFLDKWLGITTNAAWSTWTFNSKQPLRTLYLDVPIEEVAPLTTATYRSTGKTPLYDSAYAAIMNLRAVKPHGPVVFVIMTDGRDNASTKHTQTQLARLIATTRKTYKWQFVFDGPKLGSLEAAVEALER